MGLGLLTNRVCTVSLSEPNLDNMHESFMAQVMNWSLATGCVCFCVCSNYLSMLTSSLVTKELLSAAEACCFFRDSSSSSTWDRKRRKWAWCNNIWTPLALCLAETLWLQINPDDSVPAYCFPVLFRDRHPHKQIYTWYTISPQTNFTFHNLLFPCTCFQSVYVLVPLSDLALLSAIIPHFHLHTLFPLFLSASVRLSAHPHSQASQDG